MIIQFSIALMCIFFRLKDLVEVVNKRKIPPHVKVLVFDVCCSDEHDKDVDVPYIRYVLEPAK